MIAEQGVERFEDLEDGPVSLGKKDDGKVPQYSWKDGRFVMVPMPKEGKGTGVAIASFSPGGSGGTSTIAGADDFTDTTGLATDGYSVVWDNGTSKFILSEITGGGGTPGGSDTQVQFNDGGALGGDAGLTYDGSGTATLSTALVTPVIKPVSDSSTAFRFYNAAQTVPALTINTNDSFVRAETFLINTDSAEDNSSPYKMVMAIPSGTYADGGMMLTNNQAVNARKAFFSVVAYNARESVSRAKSVFYASSFPDASISSSQNPTGTFVNHCTPNAPDINVVNNNNYFQANTNFNSTSGDVFNTQSYFYVQGASGFPARVFRGTGFISRGQFAGSESSMDLMLDFHAAPIVGIGNGTIGTRIGLYINFADTNIATPYGIYQTDADVPNYFNGSIGCGVTSPTAFIDVSGSSTAKSGIRIRSGLSPNSPNDGDVWKLSDSFVLFGSNSTTNSVVNSLTLNRSSTGIPSAGFGSALNAQLKSSTTEGRDAGNIKWAWNASATDAIRDSRVDISTFYAATERTSISAGSDSSNPLLSFYGGTLAAKQAITGSASTDLASLQTVVQNLLTGLSTVGLITDSTT